jgi:MFS family permease
VKDGIAPSRTIAASPAEPAPAYGRPRYLLFLLLLGYVLSFFDRQLLVVMIEPIKRDMGASDTQFGLLYGFAFALFYTVLGLVFGRFVDSVNRTRVLAAAVLMWTAATAACGLAETFPELFVARMLVGVGEGALAPAAYSLIADTFALRRRARAFSFYGMGIWIGSGSALVLGGVLVGLLGHLPPMDLPLLGPVRGWQIAFLVAAVPGVALSLLLMLVGEPPRGALDEAPASPPSPVVRSSTRQFFIHVARRWRAYAPHHVGMALHTGLGYAILVWMPVYYIRVHGWKVGDVGLAFGLSIIVAGPLGNYAGGLVADTLTSRGVKDAYLRCCAFSCLFILAAISFAVLAANPWLGLLGVAAAMAGTAFTFGPSGAALQVVTPPWARGQAGAFYTFTANLIGLTLVPLLVALATDRLFKDPTKVGQSLLLVAAVTMLPAAAMLWRARARFAVGRTHAMEH